jgi:hypothetical protein
MVVAQPVNIRALKNAPAAAMIDEASGEPPVNGHLRIFTPRFDTNHLALKCRDGQDDRPTAYAAILDVLLVVYRTVHDHLDLFPAIGALDECGFKLLHRIPSCVCAKPTSHALETLFIGKRARHVDE